MSDAQSPEVEPDEPEYILERGLVGAVIAALETTDTKALDRLLAPLHPADIADLLEQIGEGERRALLALWSTGIDGEVLSELEGRLREEVIDDLTPEVLREAIRQLETDDVVDLVEDMARPEQLLILDALPLKERMAVDKALSYPEFSAGRLMQREMVVAPQHWTVGDTIDHIRSEEDLPDDFYHVILVDPAYHPVSYVTLGKILGAPRAQKLSDLAEESFRTIPVLQGEEDVAWLLVAVVVAEGLRLADEEVDAAVDKEGVGGLGTFAFGPDFHGGDFDGGAAVDHAADAFDEGVGLGLALRSGGE